MISDRTVLTLVIVASLILSLGFAALAFASPGETGSYKATTVQSVEVGSDSAGGSAATEPSAPDDSADAASVGDESVDSTEDSREVVSPDVSDRETEDAVHE